MRKRERETTNKTVLCLRHEDGMDVCVTCGQDGKVLQLILTCGW